MLVSEKTRLSLCGLVGKCFEMNRFLDRGMSLLDTKWKLRQCSKVLHPALAHAFLGDTFADKIGEYLSSRDALVEYPATPVGDEDYDKPVEFFIEFLERMKDLQNYTYDIIEDVAEENDHATKKFLNNFILDVVKYTEQAQILVDIFYKYGNLDIGLFMIDTNIEKYVIV